MINQALASYSNSNEELFYTIAFSMLKVVPEAQKLKMLRYFQSAENIFKNQSSKQIEWPLKDAEDELKFIEKHSIQCFSILDKYYPSRLSNISDPPLILYVKGSDHFNLPQLISIVGTRQHTHQAKKVIQELIEGLSHLKIGVISGLALGVDGIAHETAMQYHLPTWGVLAHGLDKIYPNQHRRLAINILKENGGLLTECRQNTLTMPYQFPKRNRIVAGMSDTTIVIESQVEGGSMITAKLARGYDREVFAVPGKIQDAKSKGCLWLIKNNIATMYFDPIQLLENMQWPIQQIAPDEINFQQELIDLNPIQASIFKIIQLQGPIHKDVICSILSISTIQLASHILGLELNGLIHLQAGNKYCCS
jgi:DNA processing protein